MQKYHDEPKQYKGYLKSALILTTVQIDKVQLERPRVFLDPAELFQDGVGEGLSFAAETKGAKAEGL